MKGNDSDVQEIDNKAWLAMDRLKPVVLLGEESKNWMAVEASKEEYRAVPLQTKV